MPRTGVDGHVELFGLGGAGKTTLLEQLSEQLRGDIAIGRPPSPSVGRIQLTRAWVLARLAGVAPQVLADYPSNRGGSRTLIDKLIYRLAGFHGWNPARAVVLADAGFLEPFITRAIYFGRHDRIPLEQLLDRLPRPGMAIYVRCERSVAYSRFVGREYELGRLSFVPSLSQLAYNFEEAERDCQRLVRWLEQVGSPVVTLDTTSSLSSEEVNGLMEEVRRLLRS